MNALMKNKSKDRVIIEVVSEGNAIGRKRLPHRLKMFEGGFDRHDSCTDDPSGVVVFGDDQVMPFSRLGKPEVTGRIVLEEGSRS